MAYIETRGLRKTFGGTVALDGIDLKVEEGLIPQKVLSPPDRDQRLQTEAHQGYDGPGCQGSLDDQL